MMDLPGNSKGGPTPRERRREHVSEPVVTNRVTEHKRKKAFGEMFIAEDFGTVASFLLTDVALPALRNLIVEMSRAGVERLVYGSSSGRRPGALSGTQRDRVNYTSYSRSDRYQPNTTPQPARRGGTDYSFESKSDAESVISNLNEIIDDYGYATVADLRQLAGLPTDIIDQRWGWNNLIPIKVIQKRDGWQLAIPEPKGLN